MAFSKSLVFNVVRNEPEMVRAIGINHTSNGHEVKELSDIDDQEGLRFYVPIISFYPPSSSGLDPVEVIKDGLAKALEVYYPFAGRVDEGPNRKLLVKCNNEGVVLVRARANVKLEQLGDEIHPPCPHLEKLILWDVQSYYGGVLNSPLFFFQITTFLCGGFSLGILLNHTLTDGPGLIQFLHAIGDMVKGASKPYTRPIWQRELLTARSPPRITCIHNEYNHTFTPNKPPLYSEDTFIRTSVVFGPKEMRTLRNQLAPHGISFSTFDMITACLWKCRTIALEPHPDDIVRVSMVMNLRNRKWGNIPKGYYGNAIVYPAAISNAGVLCASSLVHALKLVQQAKAEMNVEYSKSVMDLMVIKGRPKYSGMWNFIVSDLSSAGFDEIDLGWGKALYAGCPWATPVISFYNKIKNANGEVGVAVPICLPSLALKKFQHELFRMTHETISKI